MRHGTAGRRQRNRGNNGRNRGNHNRTQVFDSNGPDVRIRGTAYQVAEKYMALAKDAASVGDRILAESYLQHAEHYQRIINSFAQDVHMHRDVVGRVDGAHQPYAGQENRQQEQSSGAPSDDLALPASILTPAVKTSSEPSDFAENKERELTTI